MSLIRFSRFLNKDKLLPYGHSTTSPFPWLSATGTRSSHFELYGQNDNRSLHSREQDSQITDDISTRNSVNEILANRLTRIPTIPPIVYPPNQELTGIKDPFPWFIGNGDFNYSINPHYFKSYMSKMRNYALEKVIKGRCDVIIEVRDCRLPFASTNSEMVKKYKNISSKIKKIIVLNKCDLVSPPVAKRAKEMLEIVNRKNSDNVRVILVSAHTRRGVDVIRQEIYKLVGHVKYRKSIGTWAVMVGMPNVGKSSLVNALRRQAILNTKALFRQANGHRVKNPPVTPDMRRASAGVSKQSGYTMDVRKYSISVNPRLFVLDTPGILPVKDGANPERNVKLSLLGIIPEHVAGNMYLADYLLWMLNRTRNFNYVKYYKLREPTHDIRFLTLIIAQILSENGRMKKIDTDAAAHFFIARFRDGDYGFTCLDYIPSYLELQNWEEAKFNTEPPGPWGPCSYPDDIDALVEV